MSDQKLPILLNCIAAVMGAFGQYLYKKGGERLGQIPLYLNVQLIAGLALFTLITVLFAMAYKMGGRISVVYPFYATTFLWSTAIGVFVLGERFTATQWLGVILLLGGITLIAAGTETAA